MPSRDKTEGTAVLDRPVGDAPAGDAPSVNGSEGAQGAVGAAADPNSEQAAAAKKAKRNPDELGPDEIVGINVRLPNALRMKLGDTAKEQNTSIPQLIAQMLATAYEFELPKPSRPPRTKKYNSPEERKAAQKEAQQKQRDITRALLAAVEAGKIQGVDVEALVAEFKAEQAKKDAAEGAATAGAAAS
jgi:hypothetical protein